MFLIDDLLASPGKALLFIFEEMTRKGLEELLDDESVKRELQEIYNLLSSGKISEAEFEGRENRLLERLEQIAKLKFQGSSGPDTLADTETIHESAAEAATALVPNQPVQINAPQHEPVIESQVNIASLNAPQSPDFALGADVFQALRSLSQLVSPASSVQESARPVPKLASSCEPTPAAVVESASSSPLPIQPQPAPVALTPAPPVAGSAPKPIPMSDAVDIALRTLAVTRHKVSSITSVAKADDGWRVSVELVERAAVPDSGDLLGVYEVQVSQTGDVMRYERTRMRRRNDLR